MAIMTEKLIQGSLGYQILIGPTQKPTTSFQHTSLQQMKSGQTLSRQQWEQWLEGQCTSEEIQRLQLVLKSLAASRIQLWLRKSIF